MEKMKEIKSQITSLIDRIEHESMKINKSYDLSNLNEGKICIYIYIYI